LTNNSLGKPTEKGVLSLNSSAEYNKAKFEGRTKLPRANWQIENYQIRSFESDD